MDIKLAEFLLESIQKNTIDAIYFEYRICECDDEYISSGSQKTSPEVYGKFIDGKMRDLFNKKFSYINTGVYNKNNSNRKFDYVKPGIYNKTDTIIGIDQLHHVMIIDVVNDMREVAGLDAIDESTEPNIINDITQDQLDSLNEYIYLYRELDMKIYDYKHELESIILNDFLSKNSVCIPDGLLEKINMVYDLCYHKSELVACIITPSDNQSVCIGIDDIPKYFKNIIEKNK